jgi:subtilisin-like proprotein convertase family protein
MFTFTTKNKLLITALFILLLALPVRAQFQSKAQQAKESLQNELSTSKIEAVDLAEMKISSETYSKTSGVTHIYFQQHIQEIPVYGAILNTHITRDDQLLTFGSSFVSQARSKVNQAVPVITQEEAVRAAISHLGYDFSDVLQRKETKGGKLQEVIFIGTGLSINDIPVKLIWQPMEDESLRLAWDLNIYALDAQNWWSIRIDAATGEFLHKDNWVVQCNFDHPEGEICNHADHSKDDHEPVSVPQNNAFYYPATLGVTEGSSYNVFPPPLESPNHGSRQLVSNPADPIASPYGWHDINGIIGAEYTITRGNNVHAGLDRVAPNGIDPGSESDGGASLQFDFPLDLNLAPTDLNYQKAAVTNLFFWNNYVHDFAYHYGFDEISGNFQQNNYDRGGLGGDYVFAEAQDYSGTNNANFATPPDGENPRMQMYIFTHTNPHRDSDLDNGVIAHEYAHGISNRLTGGPANVSCLNNQEQMGEGWSDYFSLITTMLPGAQGADKKGIGTYVLGQPVDGNGIRPTPYSTDMAINPSTYNTIKTVSVPHGVGYVWATMLWDMTWALMDANGFEAGFDQSVNLVMEGMKLQPCQPGFVDGRDAILAADMAIYDGANQCLIWKAFARRGLGYSASQGLSTSRSDGTEAFDLPAGCEPTGLVVDPLIDVSCPEGQLTFNITADASVEGGDLTLEVTGYPAGSTVTITTNPLTPGNATSTMEITLPQSASTGFHHLTITGTNSLGTITATTTIKVVVKPDNSVLLSPPDGASNLYRVPSFSWEPVSGAIKYMLRIATSADLDDPGTLVEETFTNTESYDASLLEDNTTYYWGVRAIGEDCDSPDFAQIWSFTTGCNQWIQTPVLLSPADEATAVFINPEFAWVNNFEFDIYQLEIATDEAFSNIVYIASGLTVSNFIMPFPLASNTTYFWKVTTTNACGEMVSEDFTFTTGTFDVTCETYASTDVPVIIPSVPSTVTSTLTINENECGIILNVNVLNLDVSHTWIQDLIIELTSPSGTTVQLLKNTCGDHHNILINFDDQAANIYGSWPCPPTDNGTYQPYQPLSAFNLEPMNGEWTLTVRDPYNFDGGQLNGWSLEICYFDAGPLTDGGEIASSQTICYNTSPAPFTSISTPTGIVYDLEYQWQISTSSPTFVDIPGAVSETYTHVGTVTQTTWFRRLARVDCASDWSGAAESNTVMVSLGGLSGVVSYYRYNAPNTPLPGVVVKLLDASGDIIGTSTTTFDGEYEFDDLNALLNTVALEVSSEMPHGGMSAIGSLAIQRTALSLPVIYWSPAYFMNHVGNVHRGILPENPVTGPPLNVIDAAFAQQRNMNPAFFFDAGEWAFHSPEDEVIFGNSDINTATRTFTFDGCTQTLDIEARTFGDVRGIYVVQSLPGKSSSTLQTEPTIVVTPDEEFSLPVLVKNDLQLSAMNLDLWFDADKVEVLAVESTLPGLQFTIGAESIRVVWTSLNPLSIQKDQALASLRLKTLTEVNENDAVFMQNATTEFGDAMAMAIPGVEIAMNKISNTVTGIANDAKAMQHSFRPNPFTDQAVLQYTLPESGKVSIRILNQFGATVMLATEAYLQAGSHQIIIDDTDLKAGGAYYYQILLESSTKSYQVNGKMVLIK